MNLILMIYTLRSLQPAVTTMPVSTNGFMPFQDHYWLWKGIGYAGLGTFQLRWIVQWLHSERKKESQIPVAFWWLSIAGSLIELLYFLRQQDSVGVLGYCFSAVPYTRNLVLVYRSRNAARAAAAGTATATSSAPSPVNSSS